MQSITLNLDSNLSPIDLEAYKQQLMVLAQKLLRKFEKKQEPKLSDFFGCMGYDPETVNLSHKELKDLMMSEKYGV